jgi:hypothetical protein
VRIDQYRRSDVIIGINFHCAVRCEGVSNIFNPAVVIANIVRLGFPWPDVSSSRRIISRFCSRRPPQFTSRSRNHDIDTFRALKTAGFQFYCSLPNILWEGLNSGCVSAGRQLSTGNFCRPPGILVSGPLDLTTRSSFVDDSCRFRRLVYRMV